MSTTISIRIPRELKEKILKESDEIRAAIGKETTESSRLIREDREKRALGQ